MIRWRFVVTRILIVLAVLLLLGLGMGPVAKYVTVKGLQSATGAKVEIGSTQVGLFPPRISYQNFKVADPRDDKAMRDAFRAEAIEFELDGAAMLHRRWVANTGRITGLQIGASRNASGHLPTEDEMAESVSDKPGVLSNLLGGMTDRMADQAEQAARDLETVRRSREIKDRWENEYAQLAARAKKLEQQVRQFRDSARQIENPLRDWENLGNTVRVANDTRAELKAIMVALDSIPDRFRADVASLESAKQADLDRIDQFIPGDLSQSKNFGVDLVSQAVRDQVAAVREYWEGGRTLAGYTIVAPENERSRGVNIDLLGQNREPDLLVRQCSVQGMMRANGNAYSLTGTVRNLTPTPTRLAEPLVAELELDGPQIIKVNYVRDRRNDRDIDRLTLHWPQADAPNLDLGSDRNASVAVTGGKREVFVTMRSEGDQVQGRFSSRQVGVRLGLDVDSKYASLPATQALRDSLGRVSEITIDAGFSGTWDQLSTTIDTNLGDILRDAATDAVASQVAASKQQMTEKVRSAYAAEQGKLQDWFVAKQVDAQSLTNRADSLLAELSRKLLDGVESSEVTIGRLNTFLNDRF